MTFYIVNACDMRPVPFGEIEACTFTGAWRAACRLFDLSHSVDDFDGVLCLAPNGAVLTLLYASELPS